MSGAAPPERRWPWLAAAVALAALAGLAPSPAAGEHPNHAQGFRPEHAFQVGGIENVNLFQGGLTLTIPIGSYPLGPALSYGLTLVWTGNVWEWEDLERPQNPPERYLQAVPRLRSNAGLGWTLSLGRLLRPSDVANTQPFPAYESPDQAIHAFGPGPPAEVSRTGDGTYLRHKATPKTVESPDGTIRTFGALGGLIRLADPFGNGLDISRPFSTAYPGTGVRDWRLEDDHGRVHWVRFKPAAFYGSVVETVELDAFGAQSAPYRFSYAEPFVPRACNEPSNVGDTSHVKVPLLTRVELPDGSAYRMPLSSYHLDATAPCPGRMINGHLEAMELPTGGSFEWDWQVWSFPQESRHHGGVRQSGDPQGLVFTHSAGLAARRHRTRAGGVLGEWTYSHALEPSPGTVRQTESRTTVTDPLDHTSVHYFSVYHDDFDPATPEPPGWLSQEYGLPFTRRVSDGTSPGRFLSREVFDASGTHLRSTYVRYELDANGEDNPRMASRRTVYHDDGNRRADLDLSEHDGLGHYRRSVASGNFPGAPSRTTFTRFNPNGAPADSAPWVLGTYDLRQVTQGSQTVTQEFDFRPDGFLRRTRSRKGATCGAEDVVVDRIAFPLSHATSPGFLAREDVYGGDGASLPCGTLSAIAL
ncbi:MAG TPA: hypothetical protein VLF66_11650, partial [Thermoanaerobaculia bacterium]|nr:hypothetical protein [Thermoanaerobaculia bacterium]